MKKMIIQIYFNMKIVRLLLTSNNININLTNKNDDTALMITRRKKYIEIITLLENYMRGTRQQRNGSINFYFIFNF